MKHFNIVFLFFLLISIKVNAYSEIIDGINYSLDYDNKEAIVWYCSKEITGHVSIPSIITSNGIEFSVTSIGSTAFFSCSGLTSISIPNSITSIGKAAFSDCRGLTSVNIPNSVKSIGEDAFYGCI